MWWHLRPLSCRVSIACALLSLTVGATFTRDSSDESSSVYRSVSNSVMTSLAFVPLPLVRNGSVTSPGVAHLGSGLSYDASHPLLSSAFHILSSHTPKPSTVNALRDYMPSIVESFVRELRLGHVALLTPQDVVSCRHVARALLVSSTFVSVSCDIVRTAGAQLVVLEAGSDEENVADIECERNVNDLQNTVNSLQQKIGNDMEKMATKKTSQGTRNAQRFNGGDEKENRVLENVGSHLKKAALAMPPGSTILLLTRCLRVPILPIPNVHLYQATMKPGGAVIHEAWTFPGDPRPLVELRGYWTPDEGLWLEPRQYDGPKDFQGRVLRVAMLEDPPYVTLDNSSGQPVVDGYLPGILDMLAAGLNFTPSIIAPPDGKFGVELPNGSWNGIVGMLHEGNAELMLVSLAMLEPRRRVLDYLGPVEWTYYGFVVRDRTLRMGDDEVNWRAYTEPFSPALWTAAAALLISAAALWTAMVAAEPPDPTADTAGTGAEAGPPPEPLWTVLGVLVQQGAFVVPESPSQRILLGSLWVFSVVLFASFTSNIVSLLASTRYVMPFETLEQLAALTDWKIIANPENADLHQLLRVHELNRTGRLEPIKAYLPDALELLLTDDKSALFTAFSNVDHILRRNCSFVWSSIRVLPSAGFLTAQRHLPYRDALATRLTHLSEAGLLRRLWERTLLQPTAAGCRRLSQFSTMTLRQTAPALALLGVGLLAAVLVALAEWCWGRRVRSQGRGKRAMHSRKRFSKM